MRLEHRSPTTFRRLVRRTDTSEETLTGQRNGIEFHSLVSIVMSAQPGLKPKTALLGQRSKDPSRLEAPGILKVPPSAPFRGSGIVRLKRVWQRSARSTEYDRR